MALCFGPPYKNIQNHLNLFDYGIFTRKIRVKRVDSNSCGIYPQFAMRKLSAFGKFWEITRICFGLMYLVSFVQYLLVFGSIRSHLTVVTVAASCLYRSA